MGLYKKSRNALKINPEKETGYSVESSKAINWIILIFTGV
jgi:hypothetical protein